MATETEGGGATAPKAHRPLRAAFVLAFAGLGASVAAGVALWGARGGDVFLAQAFAALAACF